jgi:hypothetical protein
MNDEDSLLGVSKIVRARQQQCFLVTIFMSYYGIENDVVVVLIQGLFCVPDSSKSG